MLYPEKLDRKKGDFIIKTAIGISVFIGVILVLINNMTTPNVHWAGLANAGLIYIWITVIYAVNRNTNIAAHVLLQAIAISVLAFYIDYKIGVRGWAISLAIPIIIIVANVAMLILTIVSYKKYVRYAIYQLMICIFSLLPYYFIHEHLTYNNLLSYIATGVSLLNFVLTICLCARDVKEAISRKFHF